MTLAEGVNSYLRDSQKRINAISEEIKRAGYSRASQVTTQEQPIVTVEFVPNALYNALLEVSKPLAKSYAQVKLDIDNDQRVSWAGTAHEIRQILSSLLQILAPDELVEKQVGFQFEKGQNRPTQKQRVAFILKKKGSDDRVKEVVENVVELDSIIEKLVRGIYTRASDAAHTYKNKKEVEHILRYFETFMPDLLDY